MVFITSVSEPAVIEENIILTFRIRNSSQFNLSMGGWERKRKGSTDWLQMVPCPVPRKLDRSWSPDVLPQNPGIQMSLSSHVLVISGYHPCPKWLWKKKLVSSDLLFEAIFPTFVMDTGNVCGPLESRDKAVCPGLKGSLPVWHVWPSEAAQRRTPGTRLLQDYSKCSLTSFSLSNPQLGMFGV